ncbi:MAG: aryl-sulfate sulfotransferase [Myxococcota bacterium]
MLHGMPGLGAIAALSACLDRPVPGPPPPLATTTSTVPVPTETVPVPSTLEASCALTDNALRFDCTVTVDPPQAVRIRFTPRDGSGPERIHTDDLVAATHDIGLYFMRPLAGYDWVAETVAPTGASASGVVVTADLPEEVEGRSLDVTGVSSVPYVVTHEPCGARPIVSIYETSTGSIVWYQALDERGTFGFYYMFQVSEDHTILGETGASLVEVDLRGRDLLRIDQTGDPLWYHHDLFKRNGHVYVIHRDAGRNPFLDGVTVYDQAGEVVTDWLARTSLQIPRTATDDWMHANAIWVDGAGDFLLSSYAQHTVFKVKGDWTAPDFGERVWSLAGTDGTELGDDFVRHDAGGVSASFSDQHNVRLTADGHLLMLDNDAGRALELALDEEAGVATAVAAFPADRAVCEHQGTANLSAAGHVFVACSGPNLLEYDRAGDVVWSAVALCDGYEGDVVRWYPLEGW